MKISDEGLRLIKSFEGYHKKLANGDCTAYQTYLGGGKYDIPTIGYGCTVGVKMGMVWTEAQATEALLKEVAKHEAYVTQYVTVPMNQNEFDALVSFSYNCGSGNLKKLVARLNKGDRVATAKAFLLYVKAQGRTLPGLVSRRTREAALFQKPVEAPEEPHMAHSVTKEAEPPSRKVIATAAATVGGTVMQLMPSDPLGTAEMAVQTGQRVKAVTQQGGDFWAFLWGNPLALALLVVVVGIIAFWPKRETT